MVAEGPSPLEEAASWAMIFSVAFILVAMAITDGYLFDNYFTGVFEMAAPTWLTIGISAFGGLAFIDEDLRFAVVTFLTLNFILAFLNGFLAA